MLLILLEDPNVDIIQILPENVQKPAFPVFEYSRILNLVFLIY